MIETPETFFEQFQNFIEESGLQLKKFKSNLSNYFTKSEAIDTFLGKTEKAESAKVADSATKATQDASGNVITSTYATNEALTEGLATKLNATAKAVSAGTADTATKDGSGNVISSTYATKGELSSGLESKANTAHTHATSEVTGLDTALAGKADASALANYATKAEVPVITSSTTDLKAGTSPLATGTYYFVYE